MYKSFAEWEHMTLITEDTHQTKEAAEAVCKMLEREGYGGNMRQFPIKTWVEKINDPTTAKSSH